MGSIFCGNIKVSLFGESHGSAIGAVIDGFPAGVKIDKEYIESQLIRRRPKAAAYSTKRAEQDSPQFLSGVSGGVTTGSPICVQLINHDAVSADYDRDVFRPSHADYTGYVRYKGFNDSRGGGHFSGRLTAPLVIAGSLCRSYIKEKYNTGIFSHIKSIGGIEDIPFSFSEKNKIINDFNFSGLEVFDKNAEKRMTELIENTAKQGDSLGGVIECCITGAHEGLGSPFMQGIESRLASLLFSIPAVKGVEFGKGFEICKMTGSQANDAIRAEGGRFYTLTNNNGGILGGISNGMPILFSVGIKPTASIAVKQPTATISGENIEHTIRGRHDACIVPRALPVVESAAAIIMLDLYLEKYGYANN